ncbi:MAG TPA: PAS domain-containing protein, partial [Stellaceae bacterium]|nr:PAS domain-containing protein [Stellaceae bacterium]
MERIRTIVCTLSVFGSERTMAWFSKRHAPTLEDAVGLAVFAKTPDGILLLNEKGIVACNDAAVRLLRCKSKADITSRHPSAFAPEILPSGEPSAKRAKAEIARALKEGYARFDWVHRRVDGTTFPSQVTLLPVEIDGQRLVLSFWQDMHDVVAAREEKKRAMAQLATEFESGIGGIVNAVTAAASALQTTAKTMSSTAEETSRQAAVV